MRDRGLARGAAVEHLVAELVLVVAGAFRRVPLEHRVDLARSAATSSGVNTPARCAQPSLLELQALGGRVTVEDGEVFHDPLDHRVERTHDGMSRFS